jgi:hypothetical protein
MKFSKRSADAKKLFERGVPSRAGRFISLNWFFIFGCHRCLWGYIGREPVPGSVVPWVHFKCSMQVLEDGKNLRIMDSDKNDGAQMSWCANRFGFCSLVPNLQ